MSLRTWDWGKGFFRLWAFLSVLWVIAVTAGSLYPQRKMYIDYQNQVEAERLERAEAAERLKKGESAAGAFVDSANLGVYEMERALGMDGRGPAGSKTPIPGLSAGEFYVGLTEVVLFPFLVLAAGFCVRWIFRGFSGKDGE